MMQIIADIQDILFSCIVPPVSLIQQCLYNITPWWVTAVLLEIMIYFFFFSSSFYVTHIGVHDYYTYTAVSQLGMVSTDLQSDDVEAVLLKECPFLVHISQGWWEKWEKSVAHEATQKCVVHKRHQTGIERCDCQHGRDRDITAYCLKEAEGTEQEK